MRRQASNCQCNSTWVLVKGFCYHNGDLQQIKRFLSYGKLINSPNKNPATLSNTGLAIDQPPPQYNRWHQKSPCWLSNACVLHTRPGYGRTSAFGTTNLFFPAIKQQAMPNKAPHSKPAVHPCNARRTSLGYLGYLGFRVFRGCRLAQARLVASYAQHALGLLNLERQLSFTSLPASRDCTRSRTFRVHVLVCIYLLAYLLAYLLCIYIYICMYIYMQVPYVCMYTQIHRHIYIRIYIYIHIYIYIYSLWMRWTVCRQIGWQLDLFIFQLASVTAPKLPRGKG